MHVRVRCFGKPDTIVVVESKLTKIDRLRKLIQEKLDIEPKLQSLLYGGKLLENGYTLHDYNIKLNDVIQLMVKQIQEEVPNHQDKEEKPVKVEKTEEKKIEYTDAVSTLYEVGDLVDVLCPEDGSWYEAKIVRIVKDPNAENITDNDSSIDCETESDEVRGVDNEAVEENDTNKQGIHKYFSKVPKNEKPKDISKTNKDEGILYGVVYDGFEDDDITFCKSIRPRARTAIDIKDLKPGRTVMVNHNPDKPKEKGLWYDFKVDEVIKLRRHHELVGTLYVGVEAIPQTDTKVIVHDKIFAIETALPLNERTEELKKVLAETPEPRSKRVTCTTCRDDKDAKCKECGCSVCAGKDSPNEIILCDECDLGFHMRCLQPPLEALPADDWYCARCRRDTSDVVAPGAASQPKKRNTATNRDWGRGMACVGKTKTCAMPANHFGPIPGIEVGMCWRFRIQLSESGVHRPPVSGIHGRDADGAYSIVLGGGYEDDYDNGHEFTYTGSGGRDLSGNKRTADQSADQTLTRENKALARNCAVALSESGGDAGAAWRDGKPVRVVRSYKMLKHFPQYAPKEGLRYDGIYKVVKYYPEKGLSGFVVWKYLLRRDDPSPAPWEPNAKQYPVVYPDGYLEAEAEKKALKEKNTKGKGSKRKSTKKEQSASDSSEEPEKENGANNKSQAGRSSSSSPPGKKRKLKGSPNRSIKEMFAKLSPKSEEKEKEKAKSKEEELAITEQELELIKADTLNSQLWIECINVGKAKGRKALIEAVSEVFRCSICQELAAAPLTTPCRHNFCESCLKLAFKMTESQQCPCCRHELTHTQLTRNEQLQQALYSLLPGYDAHKKK